MNKPFVIEEYKPEVNQLEVDELLCNVDEKYVAQVSEMSLSEYPLPIEVLEDYSIANDPLANIPDFQARISDMVERTIHNLTTENDQLVAVGPAKEIADIIMHVESLRISESSGFENVITESNERNKGITL